MNVLAVNCGSSSLKFLLVAVDARSAGQDWRRLASGSASAIGPRAHLQFRGEPDRTLDEMRPLADIGDAFRAVLDWLRDAGLPGAAVEAVGHRVVHGGAAFSEPTRVDASTLQAIEGLRELAPLHNGPALEALRVARQILGPDVPMVATFDTAFHRTLPPRASNYALPLDLAERHKIRRYGFHGLAHRWMVERYCALTSRAPERCRLITLQLGSGCSAAAIEAGRSIDTSMGFTPLEGLMMGTRSGDVDPSLPAYLAEHEALDARAVERLLNAQSGLLGVSGRSADMRELLVAAGRGDGRAALAVEMFCYRVRKTVGAYLAALGGAEAIVFGGGIGEHAAVVRERICAGMDWCGLSLDPGCNDAADGVEARISADGATVAAFVIPVDEEALIVRDTVQCLLGPPA